MPRDRSSIGALLAAAIASPAIAKIVAGLIEFDAELARGRTINASEVFRSDGPLPLGTLRETFNKTAPRITGARKVPGRGRGYWEVSRDDWYRAMSRPATAPVPLRLVPPVEPSDEERVAAFLRDSGHRIARSK